MATGTYRLSRGLLDRSPRPFGSQLAGQSSAYMLYVPLALIIGASIAAIFPSNTSFVLASIVGALAGLYLLQDLVFGESPLRMSSLLAMTLLLGYCLGAANSWLTVPRANLTISEYFARDPEILSRGIAACMATCALLLFAGQLWEPPIFGEDFVLNFDARSFWAIILVCCLIIIALVTGKIGFMGLSAEGPKYRVSAFGSMVSWFSAPMLAYSVCATLNSKGTARLILAGCTFFELIAMVAYGRRAFISAVVLTIVASRLGRFRLRLSVLGKVAFAAGAVFLVVFASLVFLALRVAGYQENNTVTSLNARIHVAQNLSQTGQLSNLSDTLRANAAARTFMIGYFADLLNASQRSTPLLGRDLLRNLKLVVPSVISSDKFGIEPYEEEEQVNIQFGFSYIDESNSVLTAGAADFGVLGVVAYALLVVLLMRTAAEWVQASLPTYVAVMVTLAYMFQLLLAENLPISYFVQIRNTAILTAFLFLYQFRPTLRAA